MPPRRFTGLTRPGCSLSMSRQTSGTRRGYSMSLTSATRTPSEEATGGTSELDASLRWDNVISKYMRRANEVIENARRCTRTVEKPESKKILDRCAPGKPITAIRMPCKKVTARAPVDGENSTNGVNPPSLYNQPSSTVPFPLDGRLLQTSNDPLRKEKYFVITAAQFQGRYSVEVSLPSRVSLSAG